MGGVALHLHQRSAPVFHACSSPFLFDKQRTVLPIAHPAHLPFGARAFGQRAPQ